MKIILNKKNSICTLSIDSIVSEGYQAFEIDIKNDMFSYHDIFGLDEDDVCSLSNSLIALYKSNFDNIEWTKKSEDFIISFAAIKLNDIIQLIFKVSTQKYQVEFLINNSKDNIEFCDEDKYDYITPNNTTSYINIKKIKESEDTNDKYASTDYLLSYIDDNIIIQKNFWLYTFEKEELLNKINTYYSLRTPVDLEISDSHLLIKLLEDNKVKIEMNNNDIPADNLSLSFHNDQKLTIP